MFRKLYNTIMNFFGYEKFVKITEKEIKIIWFRSYKLKVKNFATFLYKKALKKPHNFSKNELWKHDSPQGHLAYDNGNKKPPTGYVFYVRPELIRHAVENPVNHVGAKASKIGVIVK